MAVAAATAAAAAATAAAAAAVAEAAASPPARGRAKGAPSIQMPLSGGRKYVEAAAAAAAACPQPQARRQAVGRVEPGAKYGPGSPRAGGFERVDFGRASGA